MVIFECLGLAMLIRVKKTRQSTHVCPNQTGGGYTLCMGSNPLCPVLSIPDHVAIKALYKGESVSSFTFYILGKLRHREAR